MNVVPLAAARERRQREREQRARTRLRNALTAARHVPMARLEKAVFDVEEAASRCSDASLLEVHASASDDERRMLVAAIGEERLVAEMPVVMTDSTEEEAQ